MVDAGEGRFTLSTPLSRNLDWRLLAHAMGVLLVEVKFKWWALDDGRVPFCRSLAPTCVALARRLIELLQCVLVVCFG